MTQDKQTPQLFEALQRLEMSLEQPVVPGELPKWLEEVQAMLVQTGQFFQERIEQEHEPQYREMAEQDDSALTQIEQLKEEDRELLEKQQHLLHHVRTLLDHDEALEPHESKVDRWIEQIVREGIEFVIRTRKQEQAMDTWYVEAFNRDRGVAD